MTLKRARKVRLHFLSAEPSIEGFLVSGGRFRPYRLAHPELLIAADRPADPLDDARTVRVPIANVWFIEELRQ